MCTFVNKGDSLRCPMCKAYPPGSWQCQGCECWNLKHAPACGVCERSRLLQTGGWLCKACVPHEPVAQGELMCLLGHHRDGLIYGRGRRRASTELVLAQEEAQSKRPRVLQGSKVARMYDNATPEGLTLWCPEEPEELSRQPEVAGCAQEGNTSMWIKHLLRRLGYLRTLLLQSLRLQSLRVYLQF